MLLRDSRPSLMADLGLSTWDREGPGWRTLNSRTPLGTPGEACPPQPREVAGACADSLPGRPWRDGTPAGGHALLVWCRPHLLFMQAEDAVVKQLRTRGLAQPRINHVGLGSCHWRWYGLRVSCRQTCQWSPLRSSLGLGRRQDRLASGLPSLRSPGTFLRLSRGTVRNVSPRGLSTVPTVPGLAPRPRHVCS